MFQYSAIGKSVTGQSHKRSGKPCQDAVLISEGHGFLIVACADGHGGADYIYSDEGARAAVNAISRLFLGLAQDTAKEEILNMLKVNSDIWLPKRIETEWKKEIREIHERNGREDADNIYTLYGSTLLALVLCDLFVFAIQIGDGDMIYANGTGVDSAGRILALEPSIGNDTYSLCMADCWKYFNTKLMTNPEQFPRLFMLCTDGYSNSFVSDEGFLQAGVDYLNFYREQGMPYIARNLEEWLSEASHQGSQDDVSVVLVVDGGNTA